MGYATRSKTRSPKDAASLPAEKPLVKPSRSTKQKAKDGTSAASTKTVDKKTKGTSTGKKQATFPNVPVMDQDGNKLNSGDIVNERPAVVFLYPKANTPGCTKQACGFRDDYATIKDAGYAVFGLSYDSPKSQTNWKGKHELPYSFLCDTQGGDLIKKLGAAKPPKSIKRSHFIVAKGGEMLDSQIQVSPGDSVAKALEFIKAHPFKEPSGKQEKDSANEEEKDDENAAPMDVEPKKSGDEEKQAQDEDTTMKKTEQNDDKDDDGDDDKPETKKAEKKGSGTTTTSPANKAKKDSDPDDKEDSSKLKGSEATKSNSKTPTATKNAAEKPSKSASVDAAENAQLKPSAKTAGSTKAANGSAAAEK